MGEKKSVISRQPAHCFRRRAFFIMIALICILLSSENGCTGPRFLDQQSPQSEEDYIAQVSSAPIVIVGVIEADSLVRAPIPSHWNENVPLQLRKLSIRVENVLRGGAIPGQVTAYYFTFAGSFDGPRPMGVWLIPGHSTPAMRRIFWLKYDHSQLRTACDGWDRCTIAVLSGAHLNYKPDSRPLGYALGDILLTRGASVSDNRFALQIQSGLPSEIPGAYIQEKLQELTKTETPPVKAAALRRLTGYPTR